MTKDNKELPPNAVSPFKHLIFVCTNVREPGNPRGCCQARGGEQILANFKDEIKVRNLKEAGVRATKSGCLDQCEEGANVVIYGRGVNSDGIWYSKVTPKDVKEIVESHIIKGKPVERLLFGWSKEALKRS